jgi:DNA-binding CsgD family transcriptional regulator
MHGEAAANGRIVESIYRAGAGLAPWTEPLNAIAEALGLWVVQFFAIDPRLGTVIFSHEGGQTTPEMAFDYFSRYHRIDPRAALVATAPVGEWIDCKDHFDDKYVSTSRFYQEFLIPYGGRYVYGAKIAQDEAHVLVISFLRGVGTPQLSPAERILVQELSAHFAAAFRMRREVAEINRSRGAGLSILDRLRQPLIVLDASRCITFRNESARRLMERGNLIRDRGGFAVCSHAASELELMTGLRELCLGPGATAGEAPERRGIRLADSTTGERVAATLLAVRPERVMGFLGNSPLAILAIFEVSARQEIDPFALATTFDLTPAEARVATRIVAGRSVKQIAGELGTATATVRSQIKSIFEKTGVHRQADLIRLLLLADEV